MKLYFDLKKLAAVIDAVGSGHVEPYTGEAWGTPERNPPGIMVVGDQGVYVIGNDDLNLNQMRDDVQ
ncbi:hypothetical protein QEH59_14670 [Coraliomargarita sp. SDUM461004]|uniref:Uncharacterized protein n=1 Tax=Thalassobacterium sedimentorum TaxID=3041258 RepID=A0ABU1ALJ7_9BACT|nr:hypothetical protein [Coraliomargarita sp. SDUM461004]MDQ8195675.1 hypothetical protein [Coraliomargarita sp. SDUM461004]